MNVDEESLKRLQSYYLGKTIRLNDKSYSIVKVLDVLSIGLLLQASKPSDECYFYPKGGSEFRVWLDGPTLVPWAEIYAITFTEEHSEEAESVRQKALNYAKEINIRLAAEKYSAEPQKES